MDSSTEYLIPTRAERIKFISAFTLFYLWLFSHAFWPRWLVGDASLAEPCSSLLSLQGLLVYYTLCPVAISLFFAWQAARVFRSGRSPSPGSWRLFRSRVRRGLFAYLDGTVFVLVSLAALAFAIVFAHEFKLVHLLCLVPPCECAGS